MKAKWNLGHENLTRIYQVCKLGEHKVKFVAGEGCHRLDLQYIKNLFDDISDDDRALMVFEVPEPSFDYVYSKRKGMTKEDAEKEANEAKNNALPETEINEASMQLLKIAQQRLRFSIIHCEHILKVATTIARLDGSSQIKTEHVAEAVHYHAYNEDETK